MWPDEQAATVIIFVGEEEGRQQLELGGGTGKISHASLVSFRHWLALQHSATDEKVLKSMRKFMLRVCGENKEGASCNCAKIQNIWIGNILNLFCLCLSLCGAIKCK